MVRLNVRIAQPVLLGCSVMMGSVLHALHCLKGVQRANLLINALDSRLVERVSILMKALVLSAMDVLLMKSVFLPPH